MLLIHIPRSDSGDFRVWRRAILPAHRLRRAGVAVRIVSGELQQGSLSAGATMLFAGAHDADTARLARAAREAGLKVFLDISDLRSLGAELAMLRAALPFADGITVANERLGEIARQRLGAVPLALRLLPDPAIDPQAARAGGPAILADAAQIRMIDLVRRVRRRLLDGPKVRTPRPVIVWLGDAAGLNDEGGLGELLLAAGPLVDLAADTRFRLRVIGASRLLYRRTVARLPIESEFRRFTLPTLARDLVDADLCLLPGGGDPASRARGRGRAEFCRRLGLPVIAAPEASKASDWEIEPRLRAGLAAEKVSSADEPGEDGLPAWRDLAADGGRPLPASAAQPVAVTGARKLRVVFLLQQFQDIDLICPVAEAAVLSPDLEVLVAILSKIAVPASRRLASLQARGAEIRFWRARDLAALRLDLGAGAVDVGVTASDGGGPGSRLAAAFVEAANAQGAATLNLQHGLDNGGLTYGEPHRYKREQFGSRFVLTWGGFARLTRSANEDTRAKVVPVGCTKRRLQRSDVPDFPERARHFIAVFENLHWVRYDDHYRRRFVADLVTTARGNPDLLFLLKPHMGGQWSAKAGRFTKAGQYRDLPENLVVADPAQPRWRRFGADAFLAYAKAVVTTPSTIALDAARYDLPVALVTYGIEADNYAPLERLENTQGWADFVQHVRGGTVDMAPVRAFRDAAALPGDAVARTLSVIRLAAAGRNRDEIVARLDSPPAGA